MCLHTSRFKRFYNKLSALIRQTILFLFVAVLTGCMTSKNNPINAVGFISVSEGDLKEYGKKAFEQGGNAVDAMSSMLMNGSVVLPSRMGLGAGGVCQVLDPVKGQVKTLDFRALSISSDGKIGAPSLVRGVYTLQKKYGKERWLKILEEPIKNAEKGIRVSEKLALDILTSSALDVSWKNLKKGDLLKQENLAKTLKQVSSLGAGALYKDEMAEKIAAQDNKILLDDLKNFKVSFLDSIDVVSSFGKTFFPNPTILPSDGYMIWRNAQSNKEKRQKQAQEAILQMENSSIDKHIQGVSLIAADKSGLAVVCNVSMGNTFGTGRLTDLGFYLGEVIPYQDIPSSLVNVLVTNPDVTDVTTALASVGDYVLVDALNFLSVSNNQKELLELSDTENRLEKINSVVCDRGYPNHPQSCVKKKNFYFIYSKID